MVSTSPTSRTAAPSPLSILSTEHHDYNRHPFDPIGMEALVHDKPHKCRNYAEHCTKAYVLGTSTEHYQCWKFWTPTTCATCISEAAFFKHKYLTKPSITPEDQKIVAAACLTDTLQGIRSLNYTHLPSNRSVTSKTFSTRRPTPFTNVIPVHTSKGDTRVNSR